MLVAVRGSRYLRSVTVWGTSAAAKKVIHGLSGVEDIAMTDQHVHSYIQANRSAVA